MKYKKWPDLKIQSNVFRLFCLIVLYCQKKIDLMSHVGLQELLVFQVNLIQWICSYSPLLWLRKRQLSRQVKQCSIQFYTKKSLQFPSPCPRASLCDGGDIWTQKKKFVSKMSSTFQEIQCPSEISKRKMREDIGNYFSQLHCKNVLLNPLWLASYLISPVNL